jgi:hypothetical protein
VLRGGGDELLAPIPAGHLLGEVAGHAVARQQLSELGRLRRADLRVTELAAQPAARVEATARRRVGRRGRSYSSRAGDSSTTSPRYITAIRSLM